MKRTSTLLFLTLAIVVVCACRPAEFVCPVTPPYGQNPPGENPSELYLGNDGLTTMLWPEGTIRFVEGGPGSVEADGSLAMKFPWWRGEGVRGPLTISERRLDREAKPLRADIPEGYGETGFQASGLIFASAGCWEVTARAGEAELSFVTRVSDER